MSLLTTLTKGANTARKGLAGIGMRASNSIGKTNAGQGLKIAIQSGIGQAKSGAGQVREGMTQMRAPGASRTQRAEGALNVGAGAVTSATSPLAGAFSPVGSAIRGAGNALGGTRFMQEAVRGDTTGLERGLRVAENLGTMAGAGAGVRAMTPRSVPAPKPFAERWAGASENAGTQVQRNIGNPQGGMPRGDVTVTPPSDIRSTAPVTDNTPLRSGSALQGDTPSASPKAPRGDIDMRTNTAKEEGRIDTSPRPSMPRTAKTSDAPAGKASPILKYGLIGGAGALGALGMMGGDGASPENQTMMPKDMQDAFTTPQPEATTASNDPFAGTDPFAGGAFEAGGPAPSSGTAFGTGGSIAGGFAGGNSSIAGGFGRGMSDALGMGIGAGAGGIGSDYIGEDEDRKSKYTFKGRPVIGDPSKYRYEGIEREIKMDAERTARKAENEAWGGKENKQRATLLEKQERQLNDQIASLLSRQGQYAIDQEGMSGTAGGKAGNLESMDREMRKSLIPLQTSLGLVQAERKRLGDAYATNYANMQDAQTDAEKMYTLGEDQMLYDSEGNLIAQGRQGTADTPDSPASVREYEYARSQGYTGTYDQFKGIGGAGGGDKVLSPTEAQALGVPYGTTQSQAYGTMPDKLSGDAAKLNAIVTTMVPEVNKLKQAFLNDYRGSLAGILTGTNRELVKLVDQVADKVGRLRSGGAVNADEEMRFKRQIASFMDLPFGNSQQAIDALDGLINEANQVSSRVTPQSQYGQQQYATAGGNSGWSW
jgi:hypothetical protein